jgi:hypothetical protein
MDRWLTRIACWFDLVRDLAWVLRPTRFSLVVLAIVLGVMVGSDQIRDELVAIGKDAPILYQLGIYAALCWWAFASFYWSRLVLDFELRPIPPETCPCVVLGGRAARIGWLVRQVPRVIGTLAFVVAIIGFLLAGLPGHALAALIVGGVFCALFMWWRRPLLNRLSTALGGPNPRLAEYFAIPDTPGQRLHSLREIRANTWVFLAINAAISVALLIGMIFAPVVTARQFGTINIMLLGTASWVVFGSALVLFGEWTRLPVLTVIAVYLLLVSPFNDNHAVRRLDPTAAHRPGIDDAFKLWNAAGKMNPKLGGSPARTPVIVVATEGGGVRAAYWTAILLAKLQEESPNFRDRLFAISGVSGGAVGAAVFYQLLGLPPTVKCAPARRFAGSDAAPPTGATLSPLVKCAREVLSHDFLAPTIGAFLYPDLVQRFLPFPLLPDRAAAIEKAFETGWDKSVPAAYAGAFAQPFRPFLANAGTARRPVLLLNGTSVNTGQRLITSNIEIDDVSFPDAIDFLNPDAVDLRKQPDRTVPPPVRVSTAANNAARFPYIEPGGAYYGKDHVRDYVVDGGYFENFGAATADDLIAHLERTQPDQKRAWIAIAISSDPDLPDYPYDEFAGQCLDRGTAPKPLSLAAELTIPPVGLYHTRTARGGNATKSLRHRVIEDLHGQFLQFRMTRPERGDAPPLGWALSDDARRLIDADLDRCPNAKARAVVKSILDGSSPRLQ